MFFMFACENSAPEDQDVTGKLQVAFQNPSDDVTHIHVAYWEGQTTLPRSAPTGFIKIPVVCTGVNENMSRCVQTALFENLHADNYWVQARAINIADLSTPLYHGGGTIYVEGDVVNIINIVLNQSEVFLDYFAPSIQAVSVAGTIVLDTYLDPSASGELYVAAPDEGEWIAFHAQAFALDGDDFTIMWSVKDGPDPMTAGDVGTAIPDPLDPTRMAWTHDVEGKYWVNVSADNGKGGTAAFQFNVYVSRGYGSLQVDLAFNSFPTIAIDAYVIYGHKKDLSDTVVSVMVTTLLDPDGQEIAPMLWTTDCAAVIASDPTAYYIVLVPIIVEECTATFTACDPLGCNQSTINLDINLFTLCNGFGPYEPGQEPIDCQNWCFPPDPALHECVVNDWECGDGHNACGWIESCGTCSAPGTTCIDHICSPDGGDGGI
jgi:hypothetical protein